MSHLDDHPLVLGTNNGALAGVQPESISAEDSHFATVPEPTPIPTGNTAHLPGQQAPPIRVENTSPLPSVRPSIDGNVLTVPADHAGWTPLNEIEPAIVALDSDLQHITCSIDQVNHRGDCLAGLTRTLGNLG